MLQAALERAISVKEPSTKEKEREEGRRMVQRTNATTVPTADLDPKSVIFAANHRHRRPGRPRTL
jgi:hypothetical protein